MIVFWILLLFGAWQHVQCTEEHVVCKRKYQKIGCFNGMAGLFKQELVNDRDLTSKYSTNHLTDWGKFAASIHSLACRCSKKARSSKFKYFGIRNYGLCFGGNDVKALRKQMEMRKHSDSSDCITGQFTACNTTEKAECAGNVGGEYIYELNVKDSDSNKTIVVINGGFSSWGKFGACSMTCGLGISTRERTCTNPEQQGKGAKDCTEIGDYTETRYCMVKKCNTVIDGGYSSWSRFSFCSATCDDGFKTRSRTCTNPKPKGITAKNCLKLGPATETIRCNEQECPPDITCEYATGDGLGKDEVYGGMGNTAEECVSICYKKRNVYHDINGVTIPKTGYKWCYCERGMTSRNTLEKGYQSCMMILPVDSIYSTWSKWTECSKSCASGVQHRVRSCIAPKNGGKPCQGPNTESRQCNTLSCPDFSCNFASGEGSGRSDWNIGTRISVTECVMDCVERRKYNPEINGVSVPTSGRVTCYCEKGMRNRTSSSFWKSCFLLFPVDGKLSEWTTWSSCTKSCDGGNRTRTRTCTPPQRGGKSCSGQLIERNQCNKAKCPSFKCEFASGDGKSLKEIYVGKSNSEVECIITCHEKRAIYPDINGVSVSIGGDSSCYCKRGMYNRTHSLLWKSCFMQIPIDGYFSDWSEWSSCSASCGGGKEERTRECIEPIRGGKPCRGKKAESKPCNTLRCPDFKCDFKNGDGIGGTEYYAGVQSSLVACLLTCNERRSIYPDINGVSVPSSGEISCYCKRGMTNRSRSYTWKSCFMLVPIDGYFSEWSDWTKCSESCDGGLHERTRRCIAPVRGGKPCNGTTKQTTSCNRIKCPPFKCEFQPGDGIAKEDLFAGTQRSVVDCIWSCDRKRAIFTDINGVSVPTSGRISCYCKRGMKKLSLSKIWKSCFMLVPIDGILKPWSTWSPCSKSCNGGVQNRTRGCTEPVRGGKPCQGEKTQSRHCNAITCPSFACELKPGDGIGGSDIYLGEKASVVECILACAAEARGFPDINGVSVPTSGEVRCYCERGMKNRTRSYIWKSCFMLLPVNGRYSEWSSWSECSESCGGGQMKRTRQCNDPAPLRGGKPCHGPSVDTKSCNKIKCPRYTCDFSSGEAVGGTDVYAGFFNKPVECLLACEKKAAEYNDINGVSIPVDGDVECYCNVGMKKRNTRRSWKSCFASIPVDGKYSYWMAWSKCTKSCGGGTQERSRTCTPPLRGGSPCQGDKVQKRKCNTDSCPSPIACKFLSGEGMGDDEIDVGPKNSVEECVKECRKQKLKFPAINGVSMTSSKPMQCLCEINMKDRIPIFDWKSCKIYE